MWPTSERTMEESRIMRRIAENTVEEYLKRQCKERGWICWKFTSTGKRGVPDRVVIGSCGEVTFVELKAADGSPSKEQLAVAKDLASHGISVYFVYNKAEVDRLVRQLERKESNSEHR